MADAPTQHRDAVIDAVLRSLHLECEDLNCQPLPATRVCLIGSTPFYYCDEHTPDGCVQLYATP